jgi:hypothetical protein
MRDAKVKLLYDIAVMLQSINGDKTPAKERR